MEREQGTERRRENGKQIRISDFGLLSSFELRHSTFPVPLRIPSPSKTLREKLAPKNPVFLEKNALCKKPFLKNLENKRKTTIGVMEKGKITSKSPSFPRIREGDDFRKDKKGTGSETRNSGQEMKRRRIDDFELRISTFDLLSSFELRHSSFCTALTTGHEPPTTAHRQVFTLTVERRFKLESV
jgi:hypothetical protein